MKSLQRFLVQPGRDSRLPPRPQACGQAVRILPMLKSLTGRTWREPRLLHHSRDQMSLLPTLEFSISRFLLSELWSWHIINPQLLVCLVLFDCLRRSAAVCVGCHDFAFDLRRLLLRFYVLAFVSAAAMTGLPIKLTGLQETEVMYE